MAACDNLYGDAEQWKQLRELLQRDHPAWVAIYMRAKAPKEGSIARICYLPEIQGWLRDNCDFDWVQTQLKECFEIQTMLCGKPHQETEARNGMD